MVLTIEPCVKPLETSDQLHSGTSPTVLTACPTGILHAYCTTLDLESTGNTGILLLSMETRMFQLRPHPDWNHPSFCIH